MLTQIKSLAANILAWANARNLVNGSDAKTQTLKTVSEFGEFAGAVVTLDRDEIKDGIGDTIVTMIIVAAQLKVSFEVILDQAFGEGFNFGNDGRLALVVRAQATVGKIADNVIKGQAADYMANAAILVAQLRAIGVAHGFTMEDCVEAAYNEIKDRKGVMYHGAFIKSTDERYASACAELGVPAE